MGLLRTKGIEAVWLFLYQAGEILISAFEIYSLTSGVYLSLIPWSTVGQIR